ncbi:hypothetical protein ACIBEJ_16590 [Nonomuraea sp. NPDC050790]|uniref:hypothetical protein n=1 Tax=Nonomuraea sp. NPDC050790 TaxID=3364371 RepID=UPI0037B29FC8
MIPSDVFDRLNPSAAAVRPRWPALIGAILALLLVFVWGSIPRITSYEGGTTSGRLVADDLGRVHGRIDTVTRSVFNESPYPITLTGVAARAEGFRIAGAALPKVVPAGGEVVVELLVEYTDCGKAAQERAPVVFEVSAWWGSGQVTTSPVSGEWNQLFRQQGC